MEPFFFLSELIKYQCCPHIETSQFICCANQLTDFYMRATLALNGLSKVSGLPYYRSFWTSYHLLTIRTLENSGNDFRNHLSKECVVISKIMN